MMSTDKITNITLAPNGPYIVNHLTSFSSQKGPIEAEETIALCRCG